MENTLTSVFISSPQSLRNLTKLIMSKVTSRLLKGYTGTMRGCHGRVVLASQPQTIEDVHKKLKKPTDSERDVR